MSSSNYKLSAMRFSLYLIGSFMIIFGGLYGYQFLMGNIGGPPIAYSLIGSVLVIIGGGCLWFFCLKSELRERDKKQNI